MIINLPRIILKQRMKFFSKDIIDFSIMEQLIKKESEIKNKIHNENPNEIQDLY